jgi:hypothetical protein
MLTGSLWYINVALACGVVYSGYKAWQSDCWNRASGWLFVGGFMLVLAYNNAHPYTCDTMYGTCTLDTDDDN